VVRSALVVILVAEVEPHTRGFIPESWLLISSINYLRAILAQDFNIRNVEINAIVDFLRMDRPIDFLLAGTSWIWFLKILVSLAHQRQLAHLERDFVAHLFDSGFLFPWHCSPNRSSLAANRAFGERVTFLM